MASCQFMIASFGNLALASRVGSSTWSSSGPALPKTEERQVCLRSQPKYELHSGHLSRFIARPVCQLVRWAAHQQTQGSTMNVAVLGTGMVGQALAGRLAELGHVVTVGTRD